MRRVLIVVAGAAMVAARAATAAQSPAPAPTEIVALAGQAVDAYVDAFFRRRLRREADAEARAARWPREQGPRDHRRLSSCESSRPWPEAFRDVIDVDG